MLRAPGARGRLDVNPPELFAEERRMTAAIFGLLGVIVGGVMNGVVSAMLQRCTERSEQRSAARLVRSELVGYRSLAREAAQRSPEHLPQLHDATPILWQSHRTVLARALSDEHWAVVARAYAHVDALLSVRSLSPTAHSWTGEAAKRSGYSVQASHPLRRPRPSSGELQVSFPTGETRSRKPHGMRNPQNDRAARLTTLRRATLTSQSRGR
jgi:hypothetical protein